MLCRVTWDSSNESNLTLLMYVFPLSVVHERNCSTSCFFSCFCCFLCLFLQSSRAMFENSHIWQIHVTMINMIALLFLLTCERVLELRSLDSIIPSSSLTSFDICAMFLLPVWQPEASKPPFLNILKRTTLFLSCLTCMHPATTVGYFSIQRTA